MLVVNENEWELLYEMADIIPKSNLHHMDEWV